MTAVKAPVSQQMTWSVYSSSWVSLVAQVVMNLPAIQETQVRSLDQEDPLEKEMAAHSSILAWEIPWTEEPGGLQFMGPWGRGQSRQAHTLEAKRKRNLVISELDGRALKYCMRFKQDRKKDLSRAHLYLGWPRARDWVVLPGWKALSSRVKQSPVRGIKIFKNVSQTLPDSRPPYQQLTNVFYGFI